MSATIYNYFNQAGPFSTFVEALAAAKRACFDARIECFNPAGDLIVVATWDLFRGTSSWLDDYEPVVIPAQLRAEVDAALGRRAA